MAWEPKQDESTVSVAEFLRIAERKYPGISRNPLVQQALEAAPPGDHSIKDMLSAIDPVRLRANARLRGYLPALTDEQHTLVFKRHTGVRTRYVGPKSNPGVNIGLLRKRRNYGPATTQDASDALFSLLGNIYKSPDKAVTALRELLQNSIDAINAPRVGSIARGQIPKGQGRIDITFDRTARTLTVEDNGCGMDPGVICKFTTLGGTTKGGGGSRLSAEEHAQRYPPMNITVKAYLREREGVKPPDGGTYWIRINGLYHFDMPKQSPEYLLPADYVIDYETSGSVGGFGAAKAVIFLASTAVPPKWELHTQDNLYTGEMADKDTLGGVCRETGQAPVVKTARRQGTKITIFDLDPKVFDQVGGVSTGEGHIRSSFRPIEQRMKRVVEASVLSGIRVTFNGEVIEPRFPLQSRNIVKFGDEPGTWFDGIFKHPEEAFNPSSSIKERLTGTTSDPQAGSGYPLLPSRDTFRSGTEYAFNDFRRSVEINPERLEQRKKVEGIIVFDPLDTSTQTAENKEAKAILEQAGSGEDFQKALQAAAAVLVDSEKIVGVSRGASTTDEEARRKKAEAERKARQAGGEYGKSESEPVSTEAETQQIAEVLEETEKEIEKIAELPPARQISEKERLLEELGLQIKAYLDNLDQSRQRQGQSGLRDTGYDLGISYDANAGLEAVQTLSQDDYPAYQRRSLVTLYRLQAIVQRASQDIGGGGLTATGAFDGIIGQIVQICKIEPDLVSDAKQEAGVTNPLGSIALLVKRGNFTKIVQQKQRDYLGKIVKDEAGRPVMEDTPVFDEKRYKDFQRNAHKYLPLALVWDRLVRLIASLVGKKYEYMIGSAPISTGFVLTDEAYAVQLTKISHMILINPIWATNAIKTYRNAGDLAAFLHALACHEMAHMYRGVSHKDKNGHDEKFSIIREHLAIETLGALPVITPLVAAWSKLRNPYQTESVAAMKQRYRAIAEEVTCPACLKQAVESLEKTGRLDTVRWIKERMGWESSDLSDRSHDEFE